MSSGKVLQTCEIGPGYYAGQTFAPIPGTTRFVVPDGPQLQILDALSGQPVRSLPVPRPRPGDDRDLPRVAQIHASADGSMLHLRLASEGIVALDLAAEKTLGQIASTDTWDMSPAADGRIAVAFRDRVDIFSPDLQTRLATLTGFRRRPLSCMFSPDGTRLLAIGESGILRVFESHTGIELLAEPIVAYRPSNRIQIQRFDADGRTLLMSGISDDFQLVDFRLEGSPAETTHAP